MQAAAGVTRRRKVAAAATLLPDAMPPHPTHVFHAGCTAPCRGSHSRRAEEARVIHWQEKIFSKVRNMPLARELTVAPQRELALYADKANCTTPLHEEYHARIQERFASTRSAATAVTSRRHQSQARPPGRIFTFVDHDDFNDQNEVCGVAALQDWICAAQRSKTLTTLEPEPASFLATHMLEVRRRHGHRTSSRFRLAAAMHALMCPSTERAWSPVTQAATDRQRATHVVDTCVLVCCC